MNREQYKYNSDPRYAKVLEKMDLLGIMDISTTRQSKNGTIVWKLPIRMAHKNGKFIEVASFKTGYVRNQNCGYSNYQLNKRCQNEPEYFKLSNGDYRKFETRGCVLIPIEIDRLEYLISYCLKNYYIKHANLVPNGDFVAKWKHEWELERIKDKHSDELDSKHVYDCGHYERIRDLENKLDTIQRIAEYGETE